MEEAQTAVLADAVVINFARPTAQSLLQTLPLQGTAGGEAFQFGAARDRYAEASQRKL